MDSCYINNLGYILESLEKEDFDEHFVEILDQLLCEVIMED